MIVLTRRPATWVLLALWMALSSIFGYGWNYVAYLGNANDPQNPLYKMLPDYLVANRLLGYPFFGGVIALILGVLIFGSEYGWGTPKTLFTLGPSRLHMLGAKAAGLAVVLLVFVIGSFAIGALWSTLIALNEGASLGWPSAWLLIRGLGAAWLIMGVWGGLGLLLGVVTRGTSMAIGFGLLYGLVIEGLLSAVADSVNWLQPLLDVFLRANGYSLLRPLGLDVDEVSGAGPGAYSGPYADWLQALAVLCVYAACFLLISGLLVQRRDVS
ncbi:MAG TPA: ABC transporter permease subunit [Dehalococcoidia bacterium]|nr:ABC transporter permease subunit [Dehalococcoidia bacterium]